MSDWVFRIEPLVFTAIKQRFSTNIKTKYKMGNANFTTDETSNKANLSFPNVLVNLLTPTETAEDLEQCHINGGVFTFQIEIADNQTSKARAKEVAVEINRIMKQLRFHAVMIPTATVTSDGVRYIARYRRSIDEFDVL